MNARKTSLSLVEIYAQRLHVALLDHPVLILEDLWGHPALTGFSRATAEKIVGALVHDGRLIDDGYGRLHVEPLEKAA